MHIPFRKISIATALTLSITISLCSCMAQPPAKTETKTTEKTASIETAAPEPETALASATPETKTGQTAKNSASGGTNTSSEQTENTDYDFTVCFAGDINLDEKWATTRYLNQCDNGIYDCISPELIQYMKGADIMCLNNEFTYSNRGTPLPDKAYTFRAKPKRVHILEQLGVDVVKLANNHVYDYGADALSDTFAALDSAGIAYIGAGKNLNEAMQPYYFDVDGKKIAFVAASRAEKYPMTPQATDSSPGILRCYDTKLFKQEIKKARKKADFVIAYVHWGTEYSYDLEPVQRKTGKAYLDCGADIVIGAHTHCLQGMEYHDGKPIVYSLGNYWFNEKTLDTMLLRLRFHGNNNEKHLEVQIIPAVQKNCQTKIASTKKEKKRIFSFLENISYGVKITENGILKHAK